MKKAYYALALQNPSVVAWYCALKLEMAVHLVQELVTRMLQSDVCQDVLRQWRCCLVNCRRGWAWRFLLRTCQIFATMEQLMIFTLLWNGAQADSFTRTSLCGLLVRPALTR